jgi:CRISPR-associated Csx2 family protein
MKKLITFLGTGGAAVKSSAKSYQVTRYQFPDGVVSRPVSFVGLAFLEKYLPNEIILFGTQQSIWQTLFLDIHRQGGIPDEQFEDFWLSVESHIANGNFETILGEYTESISKILKTKVTIQLVDFLETSEKMWNFFLTLQEYIDDGDEIIIDITHSFRHIPLIFMNAMMYLSAFRKNVSIAGIYYGAFEMKKDRKQSEEPAPVLDLSATWEMIQYFHAARDFKEFGHGMDLYHLIEEKHSRSAASLLDFHRAAQILFAPKLKRKSEIMTKKMEESAKNDPALKPITQVIEEWNAALTHAESHWHELVRISKWYYDRKMTLQATAALTEALISLGLENLGIDPLNKDERNDFSKKQLSDKKKKKIVFMNKKSLSKLFYSIKEIRNDMCHLGTLNPNITNMANQTYEKVKKIFEGRVFRTLLSGNLSLLDDLD